MGDRSDDATPAEPAGGLIARAVRGGDISPEPLTLVDGLLANTVSKAADYAGRSIRRGWSPLTSAWGDFARWAPLNGVEPTFLRVQSVIG